MKRYLILGVPISFADYGFFTERIIKASQAGRIFKVAPVASHPIKHAFFENKLKSAFKHFDLILPDGQSLLWAAKKLYGFKAEERIYGPELFMRLLKVAEKSDITVLLYGNETDRLVKKITKILPKLRVINLADLKGKLIDEEDIAQLERRAKKYKRAILFIGIGSPAQHYLVSSLEHIKMPIVAVGAAFDFVAGAKKQAPDWIQDIRLEWLFRLMSEPKRLWKRYLIDAPVFVLLIYLKKLGILK